MAGLGGSPFTANSGYYTGSMGAKPIAAPMAAPAAAGSYAPAVNPSTNTSTPAGFGGLAAGKPIDPNQPREGASRQNTKQYPDGSWDNITEVYSAATGGWAVRSTEHHAPPNVEWNGQGGAVGAGGVRGSGGGTTPGQGMNEEARLRLESELAMQQLGAKSRADMEAAAARDAASMAQLEKQIAGQGGMASAAQQAEMNRLLKTSELSSAQKATERGWGLEDRTANQKYIDEMMAKIGIGGASGGDGAPLDNTAASASAFARAKDRQAQTIGASMGALKNAMSSRGLSGSGIEAEQFANIIGGGAAGLGEFEREQAMADIGLKENALNRGVTTRGQNIGLISSLSSLLNSGLRY
jgi:hypothetical protein